MFSNYIKRLDSMKNRNYIKYVNGTLGNFSEDVMREYIFHLKKELKVKSSEIYIFEVNPEMKNNKSTTMEKIILNNIVKCEVKYLFILNIDFLECYQDLLISLYSRNIVDIYATSKGGKVSFDTRFSGRIFNLTVYPKSYREYISEGEKNRDDAISLPDYYLSNENNFIEKSDKKNNQKEHLLYNLFKYSLVNEKTNINSSYINDIYSLIIILEQNIGTALSYRDISFLIFNKLDYSNSKMVRYYIDILKNLSVVIPVKKYDLVKKREISTNIKYYFTDIGFIDTSKKGKNQLIKKDENTIFIELKRRGYKVNYIQQQYNHINRKITFLAKNDEGCVYIDIYSNDSKLQNSIMNLSLFNDNMPKYAVALNTDSVYFGNHFGIQVISLEEFLLKEKY